MIYVKCMNVASTETGEVLSQTLFSASEDEFPGYVDHVVRGYDVHPEYTVTVINLMNGEAHG